MSKRQQVAKDVIKGGLICALEMEHRKHKKTETGLRSYLTDLLKKALTDAAQMKGGVARRILMELCNKL